MVKYIHKSVISVFLLCGYLFVCLSGNVYVYLPGYVYICVSVCQYVLPSVKHSVHLSIHAFI